MIRSLWQRSGAVIVLQITVFLAAAFASIVAVPASRATAVEDHQSAVIFIYHRFGESRYPSTNVTLDQFEAQVEELRAGDYTVLPLPEIVSAIKQGRSLPDKTVAITVDDGYLSVFTEAWPRLKRAGLPLTVFIATDPIDAGSQTYMNWGQIRQLAEEGVTIAHHGASHHHMLSAGIEASLADIERASDRFRTELGFVPELFAYPFGEYDLAIAEAIEEAGFTAALAQYSSVARTGSDIYALPRFPINERYSDLARFRLIANARSLPVTDMLPANPLLDAKSNPPVYGFTLTESIAGLAALACYPSHLGAAADVKIVGGHRIEVRFDEPFPPGRNRINCTMPGPDGRWFWLGRFFMVPGPTPGD